MTHYSLIAIDPKGREFLLVVLPVNDEKVPAVWRWELGVVVHVDGVVIPLHYWTTYFAEAAAARKRAAGLAAEIDAGKLVQSADIYTGAR